MTVIESETFSDLVLLIGTNPLPNYIAAKYFITNNPSLKKIWLVYSEECREQSGTFEYAKNLKELAIKIPAVLEKKIEFNFVPLSEVGNPKKIENDLNEYLIKKISKTDLVHLNYTGGTKAMGIHTHKMISGKLENSSFSYISAIKFSMINDEGKIIATDLRKEIELSFIDLITLHGYKRENRDQNYDFENAVNNFKILIEKNRLHYYFDYKTKETDYNKEIGYNRRHFFHPEINSGDQLNELFKKYNEKMLKPNPVYKKLLMSFPEKYQLFNSEKNLFETNAGANSRNIIDLINFLDGKWLEEYVYYTIKNNISDKVLKNWEIKKPQWQRNKFEIDVILMKGYQLYGISCTTIGESDKPAVKKRGFEIILRTRQIGGEEARAILVTKANNDLRDRIQSELETETGSNKGNILVLGSEDLKEAQLIKSINKFIE